MIEKKLCLVITFKKTTDAMAFEEFCLKNAISGRLIPLPKEISAGCGLAWKCDISKTDEIKKVLSELKIECDKMTEIVI
jgi:hypothetical protein